MIGRLAPAPSMSLAGHAGPVWCSDHYEPTPREALHQHDFAPTWGETDEQIRVGLLRFDSANGVGPALVDIQYLPDGTTLDGSVRLTAADARAMAAMLLHAAEAAERPTRSRMGLIVTWLYSFGRAAITASRSAKAWSPRTATGSNGSMNPR